MNFIPFDIKCYNKLYEKFQFLFEAELINEICESGMLRRYDQDETLIDIGDLITHMPLVISGSIKVMTQDSKGDELLLYYLEFGDTCAVTLNCCTRKKKSTVHAITESTTEVLFIPVEKMEEWMSKYKSWQNFILSSYHERMSELLEAIDTIAFLKMDQRLFKYLKDNE